VLVLDFDVVACEKNYDSISASPFYSISASPLSKHKTRTFLWGWCWMIFNNWFRRKQALEISVTKILLIYRCLVPGIRDFLEKIDCFDDRVISFCLALVPSLALKFRVGKRVAWVFCVLYLKSDLLFFKSKRFFFYGKTNRPCSTLNFSVNFVPESISSFRIERNLNSGHHVLKKLMKNRCGNRERRVSVGLKYSGSTMVFWLGKAAKFYVTVG